MGDIWQAIVEACRLIVTLDPEVLEISGRSLYISVTATVFASLICIPLGSLIHFKNFHGKRFLINVIQTLFSIPTVVVGLFVYVLFSNAGPLGIFDLLFTPAIMIIGQTLLIIPLMIGTTITALRGVDKSIPDTARSLGATGLQLSMVTLREGRFAVMGGVIMGFGRAISEVGLALLVGGNIYGFTRVITTSISLETSMGNTVLSIALGIILLLIALVINLVLNRFQQGKRDYN